MGFFDMDRRPESFHSAYEEFAVVAIICMAQLLNQAGVEMILPMMNILGDSFSNVTSTDKVWFLAAFPLTSGAFILVSGKFGDMYGFKKTLLFGLLWSMVWTLITGLSGYSDSVIFFCICRAMHGIGLAYLLPSAIGLAGTLYNNGPRKTAVFCLGGAMAPVGATMGAVVGAMTSQFGHWQWAFYSNSICFALLAVLTWFLIPKVPPHAPKGTSFDWMGATVGGCGLVLFNFPWNQAPAVGWNRPYIIVLLILGFLLLIAFFQIEKRVKDPLIPKEVMNIHTLLILLVVGLGWGTFSIYIFYYWSFLLNINHWTPLEGGATYSMFLVFGCLASFIVSCSINKIPASYILIVASCGFLIGITMLSQTRAHQVFFNMLFAQLIILPFGMDLSFPAASLVLSDSLPKKHQGMASSLVSTTINYSMSLFLGMAGTAEAQIYKRTNDLWKSYQAALYIGVGLASLGCLLALLLHFGSFYQDHTRKSLRATDEQNLSFDIRHIKDTS